MTFVGPVRLKCYLERSALHTHTENPLIKAKLLGRRKGWQLQSSQREGVNQAIKKITAFTAPTRPRATNASWETCSPSSARSAGTITSYHFQSSLNEEYEETWDMLQNFSNY